MIANGNEPEGPNAMGQEDEIQRAWASEIERRLAAYDRGEVETAAAEEVFAAARRLTAGIESGPQTTAQTAELDRRLDELDREGPGGVSWDDAIRDIREQGQRSS